MSIRVYVVEDHPAMREALLEYFDSVDDVDVCGIAGSAEQASEELEIADPTLVLLDLSLPGRSGLELLEEITRRWQLHCIVLSGHIERAQIERAFSSGARAYVLKGKPDDLLIAIRVVAAGGTYLSEGLVIATV